MNPNERAVDSYGRCRIKDNHCRSSRPWDAYATPASAADLASTKGEHPADGSPRWTVTGDLGRVVYDVLGGHLAVLDPAGDVIEAVMGHELDRVADYARHGEDDAVFLLLENLYYSHLKYAAVTR